MFLQQDLYEEEIARDFDDQQISYIFALGFAMNQYQVLQ